MSPATTGERYWRDRCLQAEGRLQAARDALAKHGRHLTNCVIQSNAIPDDDDCTCGLVEAADTINEGRPETKPRRKA